MIIDIINTLLVYKHYRINIYTDKKYQNKPSETCLQYPIRALHSMKEPHSNTPIGQKKRLINLYNQLND